MASDEPETNITVIRYFCNCLVEVGIYRWLYTAKPFELITKHKLIFPKQQYIGQAVKSIIAVLLINSVYMY